MCKTRFASADYARSLFGLFGSEEGKEWAVSHADYFEGLLNHKARARAPKDAQKDACGQPDRDSPV